MSEEVEAPWVKYPGFPPMDGFWRQSGEYWLAYVWVPFWETLNQSEKDDYLTRWKVPEDWQNYSCYINQEFANLLETIDNEDS